MNTSYEACRSLRVKWILREYYNDITQIDTYIKPLNCGMLQISLQLLPHSHHWKCRLTVAVWVRSELIFKQCCHFDDFQPVFCWEKSTFGRQRQPHLAAFGWIKAVQGSLVALVSQACTLGIDHDHGWSLD